MKRRFKTIPQIDPELVAEPIAQANDHIMTPAERRAQRISWTYGNLALDDPSVNRRDVERSHDATYGGAPSKEVDDVPRA